MPTQAEKEKWMKRALRLAARELGQTSPNPVVGCVIVKDGKLVAEGNHKGAGRPHAEAVALARAGSRAKGADLYATLEPCCHTGKTPPCAPNIIQCGVARVFAATGDPDIRVSGGGFRELQKAGVAVETGLLELEARQLIAPFLKTKTMGLPFVTLKAAVSLDGKMATSKGESKWISSEASRRDVHRLRAQSDAIAVGIGTALADDPRLTVRYGKAARTPYRVVFDSRLRLPATSELCRLGGEDGKTIVVTVRSAPAKEIHALEAVGTRVIPVTADRNGRPNLRAALQRLARLDIQAMLLEGGGEFADAFFRAGLIDRVVLYQAPVFIGGSGPTLWDGEGSARLAQALKPVSIKRRAIGGDARLECLLRRF